MKKFIIFKTLIFLISNNVMSATVNCIGGNCDFTNSVHYKTANTYCLQTIVFEEVKTDFLYFEILSTGEICEVFDTDN